MHRMEGLKKIGSVWKQRNDENIST